MDNQAKEQVKMLLANFLFGFYIENIALHLGNYGQFEQSFLEVFRQVSQKSITSMYEQTVKQVVIYVQQSLKNNTNNQVSPTFVIGMFTQVFYPQDCPPLNDNTQLDIFKMALVYIHKHMIQCADSDRFMYQIKNYQKYKTEIVDLLFEIVSYSSQECLQSLQNKFGKRVQQVEKPKLLDQYNQKEIIDQQDYKAKYKALQKQCHEQQQTQQKLEKQISQLQNQIQLIQESVKEQKKARDAMFQLKDAKIATLVQEIMQLKEKTNSKSTSKKSESERSDNGSNRHDNDAILQHISKYSQKKYIDDEKHSESNDEDNDENECGDDQQEEFDDEISINFSVKKSDNDFSYFNQNSILL